MSLFPRIYCYSPQTRLGVVVKAQIFWKRHLLNSLKFLLTREMVAKKKPRSFAELHFLNNTIDQNTSTYCKVPNDFFLYNCNVLHSRIYRPAFGFQNLVGILAYGGHNLSALVGIGLRCQPKLCGDQSSRPHAHRHT